MEALKWTFYCALLLYLSNITTAQVKLDKSTFTGKTVNFDGSKAKKYTGIPYAEPPVGPLRFQKPVPTTEYPLQFRAVTDPPACPQYSKKPFPWYPNSTKQSEDCLYLNVWTPFDASTANKKAVMYWIPGVQHRYGAISDKVFDGTRLSVVGDIIVVTVGYRMGYFGFLTSNSPEAPGNVGFWDILEGLKWVNKHIVAFGGDPSRITIAGQGSGATNVGLLAVSPLAAGLYSGQIVESAAPVYRIADNNTQNLAFSQELAKHVGCGNDSFTIDAYPREVVGCLRGIDADRLSVAEYDLAPEEPFHLVPQWGDEILPDNPRVSVMKGDFRCTNLLIGATASEGHFLLILFQVTSYKNQELFGFFGEKNPHINRSTGEDIIRDAAKLFPDPQSILDHYLPENLTDDADYQACYAAGDLHLLCPLVYYAEKCAEQKQNVYEYFYVHRPSNSPWAEWIGATHFDEVPFVFGQPISESDYGVEEYGLSYDLMDKWSSFVRDGKPNIEWPTYSKENRTHKQIDKFISVRSEESGSGPHISNCIYLKPFYKD